MTSLDADRLLEDLTGRHARFYASSVQAMMIAVARGNRLQLADERKRMAKVIAETMGVAEVLGATLALQKAASVGAEAQFAKKPVQDILPRVTLAEAVEDMVERTPVTLRAAAERTARRISELYSADHVMVFVRSAEDSVTRRAQELFVQAMREGISEPVVGRMTRMGIDEIRRRTEAWTEGYARMAFRTNLNTAVSAGRFRQVQDPAVRQVIPAFRFDAVGDSDTRPNHGAADGRIFRVDSPVWARIAPPLGYNCRCQTALLTAPMLRRMGRLRPDGTVLEDRAPLRAHPDEGFRHAGRPDLAMVSG